MKYPYIKFYFRDWQSNSELQSCSVAARGVWIELMCIMAQCERFGYLERDGKPIDVGTIGRLIRVDNPTLNPLLLELESAGVFSRCGLTGAIFSRRMVRDFETAQKFCEFGRKGGNPSLKNLSKNKPISIPIPIPTEGLTLGVKGGVKGKGGETFDTFWKSYPKKKSKGNALKAFQKAIKLTTIEVILESIKKLSQSDDWLKDGGKYIPHPSTWLNAQGWEDEVKSYTPTQETGSVFANQKPASFFKAKERIDYGF